jgi:hypothetical protein
MGSIRFPCRTRGGKRKCFSFYWTPACIHSALAKTGATQTEKIPAAGVWCARVRSEGFKESPSYGAEGFLQVIRYKNGYPGSLRRDLLHGAPHSLTHGI